MTDDIEQSVPAGGTMGKVAAIKFQSLGWGYWQAQIGGTLFRVEPDDYVSKANRNHYVAVVRRGSSEVKRVCGFKSVTAAKNWLVAQARTVTP
jgi:hypothetical protein